MLEMPKRSVTRFFIPLIDVLTLLFCVFLITPLTRMSGEDGENQANRTPEEQVEILRHDLDRLHTENAKMERNGGPAQAASPRLQGPPGHAHARLRFRQRPSCSRPRATSAGPIKSEADVLQMLRSTSASKTDCPKESCPYQLLLPRGGNRILTGGPGRTDSSFGSGTRMFGSRSNCHPYE